MTDTTDPQTAEPLRIPIAHSVRYAARGLPEVPNQYGSGVLAPSEITLTYRAAPDSGLGRVHAYVAGRLWVDGVEIPLLPGGLYGQHYDDGLDGWPEWLAEEARLHDPDAPSAAADRAGLLDAAAQAIRDSNGSPEALEWWRTHPQLIPAHVYAAAALSVLPPAADRAAVERVRAVLETEAVVGRSALEYRGLIASALMADEAQQQPGTAAFSPGDGVHGRDPYYAGEEQPRFVRVCIACPECDHALDENGACANGCATPAAVVAGPGKEA